MASSQIYAAMKWTNDGNRLSHLHLKHVLQPRKPFSEYNVGDTGVAKYPGFPGEWTFEILALGESKQEVTEWLNDYLDLHTPSEPSTHKSKTLTDRRPVAHKSTIDKTPNVLSKVRETQRSVTLPVSENDDTSAVTVSRPADTATSKEVRETQRSVTLPVSENDDTSAVTVSKPADTATSKEGSSEQATQQATRRSLTFTENDDTSVSSPADYFHRPASKEAGLCKEGSSEKYVTMTQLEGILDGYVRKSEFRRLKRKLEEAPAVAENDDCELEQVISSQKGPFEAVEAALLKLFTIEEIKSHSATGKKANSVTPAKPRFEAAKFNLMAKLVEKHFKIGHKDIVLKTQAVKRKFAKQ